MEREAGGLEPTACSAALPPLMAFMAQCVLAAHVGPRQTRSLCEEIWASGRKVCEVPSTRLPADCFVRCWPLCRQSPRVCRSLREPAKNQSHLLWVAGALPSLPTSLPPPAQLPASPFGPPPSHKERISQYRSLPWAKFTS